MNKLKKFRNIFLWLAFLAPVITSAQDRILSDSEIPTAIQSYIKKHFPNQTISKAEVDLDGLSPNYEIKLDDQTELEFNSQYQIIKIERNSALPQSVIPQKIADYVKTNYPGNVITEWEVEGKIQQVGLDNDLDLEFTMKGDFIRIDR